MSNNKDKDKNIITPETGRNVPFSYPAEQAVLGAVLISQDAPLVILNELTEDDFYAKENNIIFGVMRSLFLKKNHSYFDHIILTSELESKGLLEAVGGVSYIIGLTTSIPSATNFQYYLDIVKKNSMMRQLIIAGGAIINNAYSSDNRETSLSFAETQIYNISQKSDRSNLEHIRNSLDEVIDEFDEVFINPDARKGLPTGLDGLDILTNGFQKSDLIILAARPGFGKTSLAMNIVQNTALQYKKSCAVFSLEMPRVQLARRMACSVAKISLSKELRGELNETEQRKLRQAVALLADAPIYIDDSSLNTPADILSKCRRLKNDPNRGLDFVMIDYLQLMSAHSKNKTESRQQEISEISRNLKILAKELNVPVLVLSQLSRAVEQRTKDHRPVLSDLRESGSIEQDADIVMFIYKSEQYKDLPENDVEKGIAELSLAKHRNGALGTIKLLWDSETTTFRSTANDSNVANLTQSAPPLPKKFKEAFDKVHNKDAEIGEIEMSEEDIFSPPPTADFEENLPIVDEVIPEDDPIWDDEEK